ncbi:MAG: hypothetical protein M0Q38_07555 [Bacteroidales bacterium]|nr:hypothetical protein [Bacteroidales bacterium]
MKPDFIEFIGNARQRKSGKFRNQLSIFIVCLILSVFIWTLVRLSKDYFYAMEYRLTYSNIPANFRLSSYSDSTLTVKIRVQGFDFITERFIVPHERQFDVSLRNIRIHTTDNVHAWGYLLTNRIGKDIVAQSSFTSDVFFVTPDTLYFEFERSIIKPVIKRPVFDILVLPRREKESLARHPDSLKKIANPSHNLLKKP